MSVLSKFKSHLCLIPKFSQSHVLFSVLACSHYWSFLSRGLFSLLVSSHSLLSLCLSLVSFGLICHNLFSVLVISQSPLSLGLFCLLVSFQYWSLLSLDVYGLISFSSQSPLVLGLLPVSVSISCQSWSLLCLSLPCPYLILILVSSQSQTRSYPYLGFISISADWYYEANAWGDSSLIL